jgi:DNA-binding GntR family transcriptional regulator
MSPLQAMERSYAALRQVLRDGMHPPGHRLEANRIADELGVSPTPVRDALNRLVGERMVEASSGEGFHVPRLDEGDLRDLYEWNSALAIMAARTSRTQATGFILTASRKRRFCSRSLANSKNCSTSRRSGKRRSGAITSRECAR